MCSPSFIISHHHSSLNVKKSLVGHNISSEQTTWLRSKWNSINCKNIVKQCEKLSYSYWFIDRDFDDLSNGDYSQQSIALIAIILVSAIIALLIPFAECVPRPSFLYLYCCLTPTGPLIFSNIWLFQMIISSICDKHSTLSYQPSSLSPKNDSRS